MFCFQSFHQSCHQDIAFWSTFQVAALNFHSTTAPSWDARFATARVLPLEYFASVSVVGQWVCFGVTHFLELFLNWETVPSRFFTDRGYPPTPCLWILQDSNPCQCRTQVEGAVTSTRWPFSVEKGFSPNLPGSKHLLFPLRRPSPRNCHDPSREDVRVYTHLVHSGLHSHPSREGLTDWFFLAQTPFLWPVGQGRGRGHLPKPDTKFFYPFSFTFMVEFHRTPGWSSSSFSSGRRFHSGEAFSSYSGNLLLEWTLWQNGLFWSHPPTLFFCNIGGNFESLFKHPSTKKSNHDLWF